MTDHEEAEARRRREEIERAAPKGLDYCAKRVIGAAYFDMTPEYAAQLRKIADTHDVIDPKYVGATGILHDLADRIDALDLSLRVRTSAPPPDHRFPNMAIMEEHSDELNTIARFLEYLQRNGWEVSGDAQTVRDLVGGFFGVDLDAMDLEAEARTTVELRKELG